MANVIERIEAIAAIKSSLRARSHKVWSVKGGTGTAWGWIYITAPKARLRDGGMTDADAAELGELLALGQPAHLQGVYVAASQAHRREYMARAAGEPFAVATPYWD